MPVGILCCAPSTLVSVGFILSLFSSSLCNFVRLDDGNTVRDNFNVDKIGFFCWEPINIDQRYSMGELEFDEQFERARNFGLTANVFGFLVWFIYLISGCRAFRPRVFVFAGLCCYIAGFFEGFKFWIFRSTFFCDDNDNPSRPLGCTYDTGGKCSISAVVFWFVAGKAIFAHVRDSILKFEEQHGHNDNDSDVENNNEDNANQPSS